MSDLSRQPCVLLVSPEYPPTPGGVGDYTAILARHLAAEGATVAVLTSAGDAGGDATEDGVRVLRRVPHWGWGLARRVRVAVRATGAEIVHIQYQTGMYGMHPAVNVLPWRLRTSPPSPLSTSGEGENHGERGAFPAGSVLRRFSPSPARGRGGRGVRVFVTFHDLLPPYLFPKAGPLRDGVTCLLARMSDTAVATNGADAATLRRWGVRPALVPIGSNIPSPISHESSRSDAATVRAQYGVPPDAPLLTSFGLLNQSKGLDVIVDALTLLREGGTPAHLLLVGAGAGANDPTNRATEAEMEARIAAAGLAAHVSRTGELGAADVAATLAAGDVCLLPYRDGASPRRGSLLAALSQGVPVVTTAPRAGVYDGLPPLTGEIAALVPPGDAAVAAAVWRILSDEAYAAGLRAGARSYAAAFGWGAIARRTLAVYRGDRDTAWSAWAAAETGT